MILNIFHLKSTEIKTTSTKSIAKYSLDILFDQFVFRFLPLKQKIQTIETGNASKANIMTV